METRIKTTDYQMPEETARYLDERLGHIEKLLGQGAHFTRCEVEVGRDAGRPRHGKNVWFAELQLLRPGADTLRATNRSESVNGAIDDAKAELERQLRNEKKVHLRILKRGGAMLKRLMRLE